MDPFPAIPFPELYLATSGWRYAEEFLAGARISSGGATIQRKGLGACFQLQNLSLLNLPNERDRGHFRFTI